MSQELPEDDPLLGAKDLRELEVQLGDKVTFPASPLYFRLRGREDRYNYL